MVAAWLVTLPELRETGAPVHTPSGSTSILGRVGAALETIARLAMPSATVVRSSLPLTTKRVTARFRPTPSIGA